MKQYWSPEKARAWYDAQPWPCGFNYIPANALNSTEMFMDYGFDPAFIEREMRLAQSVGLNCARVFLPFVVWENEPGAFKARFGTLLGICEKCGIRVMPTLFDDCCFCDIPNPYFGRQPDMIPGWYSYGWIPSPGHDFVRDNTQWPRLEPFVKDVVGTFKDDPRVWVWDMYNEPTNGIGIGKYAYQIGDVTLPLVEKVFAWAREVNPSQPLTVGAWNDNKKLNAIAFENSDVATFHSYDKPEGLRAKIAEIKNLVGERPMICTEWMNRGTGSTVADCLPVFKGERIGAMHWGLVNGKTQTHLGWGHLPGQPVKPLWQHELFHNDHSPYDAEELRLFKEAIGM